MPLVRERLIESGFAGRCLEPQDAREKAERKEEGVMPVILRKERVKWL